VLAEQVPPGQVQPSAGAGRWKSCWRNSSAASAQVGWRAQTATCWRARRRGGHLVDGPAQRQQTQIVSRAAYTNGRCPAVVNAEEGGVGEEQILSTSLA
jgi:hypothetical protein